MAGRRRESALAALLVAVLVGTVALVTYLLRSGDEKAAQAPPEQPPPVVEPEQPRAPLTGLPIDDEDELDHPAVAVKVSDVREAYPQIGVDRADIVFSQTQGVNYTRLAAVFHSDLPDAVGPVRSARPADAPLLGPLAPAFANTMASQWVLDYVYDAGKLDDLGTLRVSGTDAYALDRGRPAPDHVFAKPRELLALTEFTDPPQPYFSYAEQDGQSSAELAGGAGDSVKLSYGDATPVSWSHDADAGRYLRTGPHGEHRMADGSRISAANVLVIQVGSAMGKIGNGGGQAVPIPELVDGSGSFVALAGGRSVTGTWSKGDENDPFELETDDGDPLELTPGNTWVELPDPSRDVSTS